MKIFLDTSSLVKLYHAEADTDKLEQLFSNFKITKVYLSELSKIEFTSCIWKKVRTKEISQEIANITLQLFYSDFEKYSFIEINSQIIDLSIKLSSIYGLDGLRTLDSIQLATSVYLKNNAVIFITADKLLNNLFKCEKLNTMESIISI